MVMVLNLICVQNFHCLMVAWVKRHRFWSLYELILHLDNRKKDVLILGKGQT